MKLKRSCPRRSVEHDLLAVGQVEDAVIHRDGGGLLELGSFVAGYRFGADRRDVAEPQWRCFAAPTVPEKMILLWRARSDRIEEFPENSGQNRRALLWAVASGAQRLSGL